MILLPTGLFVIQRDGTSTAVKLRGFAGQILDRTRITKQQQPKYSCEFRSIQLGAKRLVTVLGYREQLVIMAMTGIWHGAGNVSLPLEA
jgi:hypothetical protein